MTTPYSPGAGVNAFAVSVPPEVGPCPMIAGNGSPENVVPANPGTGYQDLDTNDMWVKFAGVQKVGWHKVGKVPVTVTASGTGGLAFVQVFSGNGSPVGVVAPMATAAFYIQKDSEPPGILWSWYDSAWH